MLRVGTVFAALLVLGGCARSAAGLKFQGSAWQPIPRRLVVEAPAVPARARVLGALSAHCERPGPGAFADRALVDVDCSPARLELWLREAAAARGGDVLAALKCRGDERVECHATLARTEALKVEARAAVPADPAGASLLLSYEPGPAHLSRPARPESAVRELTQTSPELVIVGALEAKCEACAEPEMRSALRVAAGRLGASDVVGVRCFMPAAERARCVAELAVTEAPLAF